MALLLRERRKVLPAKAQVQGYVGPKLPVVLTEKIDVVVAKVALGDWWTTGLRIGIDLIEQRRAVSEVE